MPLVSVWSMSAVRSSVPAPATISRRSDPPLDQRRPRHHERWPNFAEPETSPAGRDPPEPVLGAPRRSRQRGTHRARVADDRSGGARRRARRGLADVRRAHPQPRATRRWLDAVAPPAPPVPTTCALDGSPSVAVEYRRSKARACSLGTPCAASRSARAHLSLPERSGCWCGGAAHARTITDHSRRAGTATCPSPRARVRTSRAMRRSTLDARCSRRSVNSTPTSGAMSAARRSTPNRTLRNPRECRVNPRRRLR